MKSTLPKWYDLHTHLRQGGLLGPIIQSQIDMGCCGLLAMPNTKPPLAKVLKDDPLPYWCVQGYIDLIKKEGGEGFQDIIVPLYLTKDTTPKMIEEGAKSGLLRAAKYYPPHGTTGADFGMPFESYFENGVFEAMEANGVVLCIHGEEHGLDADQYFNAGSNAEDIFYRERMPKLVEKFPNLKVACEHVTTKIAVEFVQGQGENVAASITPQHLLYTIGDLLKGLHYHLYCLPLLKFEEDRAALRAAVTDPGNIKFYAGTDSAAHTEKATKCGCAAGCFTGGIAPQLYAQGFEEAGADLSDEASQKTFEKFLCHNGPAFYSLEKPQGMMTLEKTPQKVAMLKTSEGEVTPLPLGLGQATIPWSLIINP